MSDIFRLRNGRSRAINAENPTGEKGKGGIAASHLGPSRKGSPCLKNIMPNETVVLAEMDGPGIIQGIHTNWNFEILSHNYLRILQIFLFVGIGFHRIHEDLRTPLTRRKLCWMTTLFKV